MTMLFIAALIFRRSTPCCIADAGPDLSNVGRQNTCTMLRCIRAAAGLCASPAARRVYGASGLCAMMEFVVLPARAVISENMDIMYVIADD